MLEYEKDAQIEKDNLTSQSYIYKIVIDKLEKAILKSPNIVDTKEIVYRDNKEYKIYCRHYYSSLPQYTLALYFINSQNKITIIKVEYSS